MSLLRKLGMVFGIAVSALLVANYIHFHRTATCYDCFFRYGVPFTVYHDGGYAGGAAIVWRGVVANLAVLVGTVAAATFAWHIAHGGDSYW